MFIQVKLLHGSSRSLWYQTPNNNSYQGAVVQVPLKNSLVPALVINEYEDAPKTSFDIKFINALEPFPADRSYEPFTRYLAHYYQIEPLHFFKRIRHFLQQKNKPETNQSVPETQANPNVQLTDEQLEACAKLKLLITQPRFAPCVLQGVTGSGKTEVYKQLICTALEEKKSALFLLPEVTLALGFEHRLKKELPGIAIAGFHSATSAKEKRQLWDRLVKQQPTLIIGVHLPVLLPIPNLGVIIIDEEHDAGYQEKKHPKINSKQAALMRAQVTGIPIILGSATPSFQTLHQVATKKWLRFRLTKRFAGSLPEVKMVLLNDKKQRKYFWISDQLKNAIAQRLVNKEQTIIFINRRGYSFFVQCKQCSFIFECDNCSVSLTLHGESILSCHYCGITKELPTTCPQCKKDASHFLKKGIGTQQVVSILQSLFPHARIARADLDTTVRKKEWQQTMKDFSAGALDILVGTQTITKGYDFPNVTLVGVLWADLQLHFPMYNAAEQALQQLIQVAGRAGRRDNKKSLVIIQTLDNHAIFNFVDELQYEQFYEQEVRTRILAGYPPCKRLAEIELKHKNESVVQKDAQLLFELLMQYKKDDIIVLGPAKPPVHKIKNIFTRKIYLKATRMESISTTYRAATAQRYQSSIFFTPNPMS